MEILEGYEDCKVNLLESRDNKTANIRVWNPEVVSKESKRSTPIGALSDLLAPYHPLGRILLPLLPTLKLSSHIK